MNVIELSTSNSTLARRAVLKIESATVLAAVDGLNLSPGAKVSAVIGLPLRSLQQRRDVTHFAVSAPLAAVKGLLEVLALDTLDQLITLLGDHAESPTFEQLDDAITLARNEGRTLDDVVAVLAFAIAENFPAAAHCRQLFEERAEFTLPELPSSPGSTEVSALVQPKAVDPAVREQRRARREAQKSRRRTRSVPTAGRPVHSKAPKSPPSVRESAPSVPSAPSEARVSLGLTPLEARRFDTGHALVGSVILAEVPFSESDPSIPEATSKERPVLVVAGSARELLVRPLFSNPGPTRQLFGPWRRLGLDHPSYLDLDRVAVATPTPTKRLGQVSDVEWNALR